MTPSATIRAFTRVVVGGVFVSAPGVRRRGRRPSPRGRGRRVLRGARPMTQYPDLFAALAAPFEPHEVKTRLGSNGRALTYITARTAMNRLDGVLGPENWHDDYTPLENSVICRLTVRLPDGREVTKC